MSKLLSALMLGLMTFAGSASAATFHLNVSGSLVGAYLGTVYAVDASNPDIFAEPLGAVAVDDPDSPYYWPFLLDVSGNGGATIDTDVFDNFSPGSNRVSNCTGILAALCSIGNFFFDENTGEAGSGYYDGFSALALGPFTGGSIGSFRTAFSVGASGSRGIRDFAGGIYSHPNGYTESATYVGEYIGQVSLLGGSVLSHDYNLTSYEITAVPIPATFPLLAVGLGAFGAMRLRKRKSAASS